MAPPIVLWLAIVALVAFLIVRTIRKDRREYQRFKRYRTTVRRQRMLRTWLLESLATFGGLTVVVLVLSFEQIDPLLREVQAWPLVASVRSTLSEWMPLVIALAIGSVVLTAAFTIWGIRSARRSDEPVPSVGDIQAILPRNRQELRYGAALSVNAGVVEELLFRLALPALVFGATGSAVAAVVAPAVLFGLLHLYQGPLGVIASTVVGAVMMLVYVLTGSVLWPILLHALFDLRTLVVLPVGLWGVHRIDGNVQRVIPRASRPPTAATRTS